MLDCNNVLGVIPVWGTVNGMCQIGVVLPQIWIMIYIIGTVLEKMCTVLYVFVIALISCVVSVVQGRQSH